MSQTQINPLTDFSSFPRFDAFKPELVTGALDNLLAQAAAAVDWAQADMTPATWDSFVEPLDSASEKLSRAWSMVSHLNAVADEPALRETYNANLARVTQFWTALGQNKKLFAKYLALAQDDGKLNSVRKHILQHTIRSFRLSGAQLESPASERYAQIQERKAQVAQKFSENVLDATNAFSLPISDEAQIAGLPDDVKAAAAQLAQSRNLTGFLFTAQAPSFIPLMQYCENRALRETMYRAYVTRASALASAPDDAARKAAMDNSALIDETLCLRAESSKLLGYENYAELSMVPKMAQSPQQVITFLRDLAKRARPFAERDLAELKRFAADKLALPELAAWDTSFASERLKEARYAFSENEVKQYLQLPNVLAGLFELVQTLFRVAIAPAQTSTWHPDVKFFKISRDGSTMGHFYLDLYARQSKRPGAWMDDARSRKRDPKLPSSLQTPVAYLVCNLQPPIGERPALLTHDDVITLFHEFGHGLHHLLTQVDEIAVSGISGVEWDAVELPSQFMENFCWDYRILQSMTAHIDSGQSLPRPLFDKMLAAKNYQAGMQTLRQVEFALFDMLIHSQTEPATSASVQQVLDQVRNEVSVLQATPYNRFQNSFSHIFAGGYAAGYYSYKWAEVLSADCFAAFEEKGVINTEVGSKFLAEILSVGGSRPAIDSFRAFRGRDPSIDALLRHNGMTDQSPGTEQLART